MLRILTCTLLNTAPPRVCPSPRSCIPVPAGECSSSGDCGMDLEILIVGALRLTRPMHCNSAPGKNCSILGQMCVETVPVNSTVPQLPPVPPILGAPNCSESIQISCLHSGNCNATFLWEWFASLPEGSKSVTSTCVTQPECTCVFQGNVCYTPQ